MGESLTEHWLIAMDSDGTCDVGSPSGPVKVEYLKQLSADGHRIVVIGNVQLQLHGFYGPRDSKGEPVAGLIVGKSLLLSKYREMFPKYDRYVVVDDQFEQYADGSDGWERMSPEQFLKTRVP